MWLLPKWPYSKIATSGATPWNFSFLSFLYSVSFIYILVKRFNNERQLFSDDDVQEEEEKRKQESVRMHPLSGRL